MLNNNSQDKSNKEESLSRLEKWVLEKTNAKETVKRTVIHSINRTVKKVDEEQVDKQIELEAQPSGHCMIQ